MVRDDTVLKSRWLVVSKPFVGQLESRCFRNVCYEKYLLVNFVLKMTSTRVRAEAIFANLSASLHKSIDRGQGIRVTVHAHDAKRS
jgi:hypothetical protein